MPVDWEEIRGGQVKIIDAIKTSLREHLIIYGNFFNTKIFAAILLIFLLIYSLPFLTNPQNLTTRSGDFSDFVWPDYYLFKESVLRYGEIPLWNPTVFSGIPEIANPQAAIIYPLNYLSLFLSIDYAILILIMLHAFLSGILLYKLGREIFEWKNLPSFVFSFVYTFSPYFWGKALRKGQIFNLLFSLLFLSGIYLNYPTIWYYTCLFGIGSLIFYNGFKIFRKLTAVRLLPVFSVIFILPIFKQVDLLLDLSFLRLI
jgi:hypothetical protein